MTNIIERRSQDDFKKRDPEEHEEPHPIEKSWCKKHSNHPYCYSQFCRDHPGSCKVTFDSVALPPPPPPVQATVTATVTKEYMVPEKTAASSPVSTGRSNSTVDSSSKETTQSIHKRSGWYCLFLC